MIHVFEVWELQYASPIPWVEGSGRECHFIGFMFYKKDDRSMGI
jgi:hypothetical protein